ncbi:hypothetical protein RU08_17365 [Pseudomonas fulva]|uniref:Uncharacterized protein n=1 Tax=Pseudomonas fulva TaxID=47880 RepID=A0A0D0KHY5_9PSED|nr:hypothetical protein RU08_17365 [Pseudomonas fulva]
MLSKLKFFNESASKHTDQKTLAVILSDMIQKLIPLACWGRMELRELCFAPQMELIIGTGGERF